MADVHKTLFSVGQECDEDQWVIFTKCGGVIYSLATGASRPFRRTPEGQYEMDIWVPPPGYESGLQANVSGFTRPGQ